MNHNRNWRVVTLLSVCFAVYILFSVLAYAFHFDWKPFKNINLISEIIKPELINKKEENSNFADSETKQNIKKNFELYKKADLITNFSAETNEASLVHLVEKLDSLIKNKKGKIRIAYFGDSMIEGDLLTKKLRQLLQQKYGGNGVGFLPMQSKVAPIRETSEIKASGWSVTNFMDKGATNMYISGFSFKGAGNTSFTDKTLPHNTFTSKYLIFGRNSGGATVRYDSQNIALENSGNVNRQLLSKDSLRTVSLKSNSPTTPFYGISIESDHGIILDNYSFRGITGVEFKKIDENFLQEIQQKDQYDLVIMQYGVNLLFRPDDTEYSYYVKLMTPVLEKFKKAFPNSDLMMVSTADRAFRYNGEFQSAKGVKNLVETQAKMAFDNGFSFFNLFETMGGENSIVKWASMEPPLANKDYVHPNGRGTDILAKHIFDAIIADYKKFTSKKTVAQ
ncbi:hypothetical protein ASG01_01635 [Chryseobacterium sp. Leaf180]|uniref:hypothetical protein n=1 Tax=Chryseobacterium sp. Leaf180 TaxID=1736289 RepID=UPI0006F25A3F|nr:hypothetical protein [Chryseobacterium sp. Leaf180]KQR94609.1 hypothetical protein ASG01_01635 [Chryseobacterium sp. Leaf180]